MDMDAKKKKTLELLRSRRQPAPVSQPMPGRQVDAPQEEESQAGPSRYMAAIQKRRGK